MSKGNNQKMKIVKLLDILRGESDENHPITTNKLIYKLQEAGIDVERKTLYDDIKMLNEWGYEILTEKKGHANCYYIADRYFDLPELKILLDAVQSASFITPRKTKALVEKIANQAGSYKAELMKKNIIYYDNLKHTNERIYYNIDAINEGILQHKKVSFIYFDYDINGKRVYRKRGARYTVNPIVLTFSDDNYYLTSSSDNHDDLANYRLDKMDSVMMENKPAENVDVENLFGFNREPRRAFSMYMGKEERVKIVAKNELVGAIMDRFGEKIKMTKIDEESFCINVAVQISPTFFAWCFTFGNKLKVTEPEHIVEQMKNSIKILAENYN